MDDSIAAVVGEVGGGGREVGGDEGDDQDDAEYNFLADQQEDEKEEFRNDRAVKISRKWVLVLHS